MTECSRCKRRIREVPFNCRYCHKDYCSNHRLPEDHKCKVLEKYKSHNKERWKKAITSNKKHRIRRGKHKESSKKQTFFDSLKNNLVYKYDNFFDWLRRREHHKYNYDKRTNYLITTSLLFLVSIVGFSIFYSNIQRLNEINLWIIKLGGLLLLVSSFFIIKYSWRIIKELINLLKRQRNWLKYLIIILIIFLLWQAYTNKDTVLNPLFDVYNNTNFSYFAPVGLGNFSLESGSNPSSTYSNINNGNSGFGDFVQGVFDPKSKIDISELEQEVHRRINTERTNNGLRPLSWDSKIVQIAREHSEDMIARNFYSHDNPDGEDPTDRGNRHGYDCTKDYGSYYTYGLAENIAITPIYSDVIGCGSTTSLNSLAECIVDGWMTSTGHRENILTSTYTKTGIGIAYSENDEAYSTQNFC